MARSLKPSAWIERDKTMDGEYTYRVRWEKDGIRGPSIACGPNREHAEQVRSRTEQQLWASRLNLPVSQTKSWKDFCAEYLEYSRTHKAKNTVTNFDEPTLTSFSAMIGDPPLSSITPASVESWKLAQLRKLSPNTVRMRLRTLKAVFNYATRLGLFSNSPAAAITAPPEEDVARALSPKQISAGLEAISPLMSRAVMFTLHTGVRRGELLALDWGSVRTYKDQPWEVLIAKGKTRRQRIILLHPTARAALGPQKPSGLVFEGMSIDILESGMKKMAKAAKASRIRFHDLRHTWATEYMRRTGDIHGLRLQGGWRSDKAVAKYQHLTRPRLEANLLVDFGLSSPAVPPK